MILWLYFNFMASIFTLLGTVFLIIEFYYFIVIKTTLGFTCVLLNFFVFMLDKSSSTQSTYSSIPILICSPIYRQMSFISVNELWYYTYGKNLTQIFYASNEFSSTIKFSTEINLFLNNKSLPKINKA